MILIPPAKKKSGATAGWQMAISRSYEACAFFGNLWVGNLWDGNLCVGKLCVGNLCVGKEVLATYVFETYGTGTSVLETLA